MAGFDVGLNTGLIGGSGIQKTVFTEKVQYMTSNVPVLGDIKIIEKKNTDRDLETIRSFLIKDPNDDVVSTIFRFDDEDDPIFYYVPFRVARSMFSQPRLHIISPL